MGGAEEKDPFKRSIGVYLDKEVLDALDELAVSQRRSRNWMINELCAQACGLNPAEYIGRREKEE